MDIAGVNDNVLRWLNGLSPDDQILLLVVDLAASYLNSANSVMHNDITLKDT